MFIELTHTYSGEKIFFRVDKIHTVREKEGKTLVITDVRGYYVDEPIERVLSLIQSTFEANYAFNGFFE